MEPHVFVVMPFGVKEAQAAVAATDGNPAKPAIKIDFTEVYKLLIKDALTKAGCVPFRADEEQAAGDIRTDMYFELVTADIIVADISILNPNVFYELGVRHGVAQRGVLMIHGGWHTPPFDIAPDRRFEYDGKLFNTKQEERDDAWKARLSAEVEKLSKTLKDAIELDKQTVGSPVYKELVGLQPVDWTNIKPARAKYFGDVFVDWKSRVKVAKLNGLPGDILTFADDAPTRFHQSKLLWEAADALIQMQRFDAAKPVLDDLLALDPSHHKAQTQMGLVLNRLKKVNEARVYMQQVAEQYSSQDTEAQGILARVYKDLWKLEWEQKETLEERQREAVISSDRLANAVRHYDSAAREHRDYYNGINVVSALQLLDHLRTATGDEPVDCDIKDLPDLISVVRFAAQHAFTCAKPDSEDAVWALGTLAELELVAGEANKARGLYRRAANSTASTYFQVNSMLEQVLLFDALGFKPEAVTNVKQELEQRRTALKTKVRGLEPSFKKVLVASGHMIDLPGKPERFPPGKEGIVRDQVKQQLKAWEIGAGHLTICGGARGSDIIVAEEALARGAEVWLFLPLSVPEFLEESIRGVAEGNWEERFRDLQTNPGVKVFLQDDRLKSPPKGTSVFARNNLWMINTARVEADDPRNLYVILVWDEQSTGYGPGGTSDFARRVKELGGRLKVINPTKL